MKLHLPTIALYLPESSSLPTLLIFVCLNIELDKILSKQCGTHALIDNALRAYLGFSAKFKGKLHPHDVYDLSLLHCNNIGQCKAIPLFPNKLVDIGQANTSLANMRFPVAHISFSRRICSYSTPTTFEDRLYTAYCK